MSKLFGKLREGDLTKYGYSTTGSEEARHKALRHAEKKYGSLTLFRKLDAVAKLSVSKAPRASRVFRKDRAWVLKRHTRKRGNK